MAVDHSVGMEEEEEGHEEGVKEDSDIWMQDETAHWELNYGPNAEG